MKALPQQIVSQLIVETKSKVTEAKLELEQVKLTVQTECLHQIVSEMPYQSGITNATRICNHCLLEEEGSHWSSGKVWSVKDHAHKPALGNDDGRLILNITRDEFFVLRRQG
jgi:hypothetical protein